VNTGAKMRFRRGELLRLEFRAVGPTSERMRLRAILSRSETTRARGGIGARPAHGRPSDGSSVRQGGAGAGRGEGEKPRPAPRAAGGERTPIRPPGVVQSTSPTPDEKGG